MSFDYKTTLNQLAMANNGINRLQAMIGAYNFVLDDENKAISFRFKMSKKFNYCKITLDANDTYNVSLMKIWGSKITREKNVDGQYFDMLKPLFEKETGLYLSL